MSSIQFDYSTLSTSVSRSELGAIIGHHIVEGNYGYDISEEGSSERSSETSEIYDNPSSPPDKFKLVFLTFGLLGIGTLLPWNFFITANDYWMYKFRDVLNKSCVDNHNKTDLQAAFTSYLALSNNVPYVLFLVICTIFNNKFSKVLRVIAPLLALFLLFGIVTACVEVNTDSWQMGFFDLTIFIIIMVGVISAVLQTGVAAVASLLPPKYMHIMVLGQAFAGILASAAQTLSLLGNCDSIRSALVYFCSADFVLLTTLIAYAGIHKSVPYARWAPNLARSDLAKRAKDCGRLEIAGRICSTIGMIVAPNPPSLVMILHMQPVPKQIRLFGVGVTIDVTLMKDVSGLESKARVSIWYTLKMIWPYAVAILLDFWVTIGIFPGLAVLAIPQSTGGLWNGKLFLPLACFLLFNVSDFCGRAVGGWLPFPHSRRMQLLSLCVMRIAFIPMLMLCNLQPRYHLPVMMPSETAFISLITMLGFTNGYFVASSMLVGIKSVNPVFQEMAGVILSTFLGGGLMLGALTSYICIKII